MPVGASHRWKSYGPAGSGPNPGLSLRYTCMRSVLPFGPAASSYMTSMLCDACIVPGRYTFSPGFRDIASSRLR